MPDGFPVTITDDDGQTIEVGPGLPGAVCVRTSPGGVLLDAGQRERLAQAIVAASWATGRVAVSSHDEPIVLRVSDYPPDAPEPEPRDCCCGEKPWPEPGSCPMCSMARLIASPPLPGTGGWWG